MKVWQIFLFICTVTIAKGQRSTTTQGCGGNYVKTEGNITSPGFGVRNYPSTARCTWTINVPQGFIVEMEFVVIDVEPEADCSFDGILLYDITEGGGPPFLTQSSRLLGGRGYCGDKMYAPVYSETNLVGVHFYSDDSIQAVGFRLKWIAKEAVTADQFNCTFEQGLCEGWRNVAFPNDDFDWQLHRFRTPTPLTGPTFDHTLNNTNGQYIYIETSAPRLENDTAVLISPQISFSDGEQAICVSFWYHMLGISVGSLTVSRMSGNLTEMLWQRSGQQGEDWLNGMVELNYTPRPLQVIFAGTRGELLYGDISLDDMLLTSGPCSEGSTNQPTFSPTTRSIPNAQFSSSIFTVTPGSPFLPSRTSPGRIKNETTQVATEILITTAIAPTRSGDQTTTTPTTVITSTPSAPTTSTKLGDETATMESTKPSFGVTTAGDEGVTAGSTKPSLGFATTGVCLLLVGYVYSVSLDW